MSRIQHSLQSLRRHPVLLRRDEPDGGEPRRQRGPGPMENGPRGHRRRTPARRTHQQAALSPPGFTTTAGGTDKAVRPTQLLQVHDTRSVVGKPRQQFLVGARIVGSGDRELRFHTLDPTAVKQICGSAVRDLTGDVRLRRSHPMSCVAFQSRSASHDKLRRGRELLRPLGDPQDEGRAVHVVGTADRGSVTAFVAAIVTARGLKVGAYQVDYE